MISIIIPIFNEEDNLKKLIPYLQKCCIGFNAEIIISDGGSTDNSVVIAKSFNAKVVTSSRKGRSVQMNEAAAIAIYDIYYFVHADSIPPASFFSDILEALKSGYEFGRYCTQFEGSTWLLKLNAYFTRFDWFMCYGGDQTLFITRALFNKVNGYNEHLLIMEEYDLVNRARQFGRYKIFSKATIVSIRKYENNSWFKVQRVNYITVQLFKKGIPQSDLIAQYRKALKDIK